MNKIYDAVVIGGGVIGGTILRELVKYELSVCLVEAESDVCMGQSKANSGIVHAGFDAEPDTKKVKFNVAGNKMMYSYAKELGVKCEKIGSLVVAYSEDEKNKLGELMRRGEKNGVDGLRILDKDELFSIEPNISDKAVGALLAETGGIVCPYELTVAAIGNAMDNGAELFVNFKVVSAEQQNDFYTVESENGQVVAGRVVINCAGLDGEKVAKLFGDTGITLGGRKGEYILLDRESGDFVSHTLFRTPSEKGKGVLVTPTVDGNILLGPTAEVVESGDTDTTQNGLEHIKSKVAEMCKNVPLYNAITSFAGVRAFSSKHDFIIEKSSVAERLINCVGIESPGLTSAPAIAKYVVEEIVSGMLELKPNRKFDGKRTPDCFFKDLTDDEKNAIISRQPEYGKIVCRCEQITEGEILRAIRENPKATSIDAVKRRTRAGMGRCQGGFCQIHVAEILSRELGIPFEKITKNGAGSEIVQGRSK